MLQRIVVGIDGSDRGRDALALATWLAGEGSEAEIIVANVYLPDPLPLPGSRKWEDFLREESESLIAEAETSAPESIRIGGAVLGAGSAAQGLQELCERHEADLVVIGSSHRSRVGEVLAGSVGQRLLHGSACPVAIAPSGFRERTQRGPWTVIVGYDGSEEAKAALAGAVELARRLFVGLQLITVAEPAPVVHSKGESMAGYGNLNRAIEELMQRRLDEGLEEVSGEIEASGALLQGDAAEELSKAGVDAGLLVLGSRAYGPLRSVLLGSVSAGLVRAAPCPVMVFPRGAHETERTRVGTLQQDTRSPEGNDA